MANKKHLEILSQGVTHWNQWRETNPKIKPNLTKASLKGKNLIEVNFASTDLSQADLSWTKMKRANLRNSQLYKANLHKADLREADLFRSYLESADLSNADLREANINDSTLIGANLSKANLIEAGLQGSLLCAATLKNAKLSKADLKWADLTDADLSHSNLSGAELEYATLVETCLINSNLTGCSIYGISAWDLELEGADQTDLIITQEDEPVITVDNLEVAQFIYLLINNNKIRQIIDTITSKVVLILGRFTHEHKVVLDALRDKLRHHDYLPVLFDFDKPSSRDLNETISTLAHMARFVIADITDPRSIPQELQTIVPNLPSVPVQPIMLKSSTEYGMFEHFKKFPWVLEIYHYSDQKTLLESLADKVIAPAIQKAKELTGR